MTPSLLEGRATPEGTARLAARFPGRAYAQARGLTLSTIGLGTYLGPATQAADAEMAARVRDGLAAGVNVFDTAINYRHQRSERAVGDALSREILAERVRRDEVFLATKGGFLPFDANEPPEPMAYLHDTYLASGLLKPVDVAQGCHAMAPAYLRDQLSRSLRNLQAATVDVYFVHNPETQRQDFPVEVVRERFLDAFEALEREADAGRLATYGVATWQGLRVDPEHPLHLSLETLLEWAAEARERVGPGPHHFGAIELPVSLAMPEAATRPTQRWRGQNVPVLDAAREAGLIVLASAPLLQGRLARGLPPQVRAVLQGDTDAQRAIQFARSAPGVTSALVGMLGAAHAAENLEMLARPPDAGAVASLLKA